MLKDSCQAKLDKNKFVNGLRVVDWKRASLNETDIAYQLMNVGPLSVALNALLLQFYFRGVFDPFVCNAKELNHAVLMVGWGVRESKIFGNKPYWIVKNRYIFILFLIVKTSLLYFFALVVGEKDGENLAILELLEEKEDAE